MSCEPRQVPTLFDQIPRRPAVPVAIAMMIGIFAHRVAPVWPIVWIGVTAALVALASLTFHREMICSIALLLAIVTGALSTAQVHAFYYPRDHISAFATDDQRLAQIEMRVTYPPRVLTWPYGQFHALPPRQAVTMTARRILTKRGWVDCTGDMLVQIQQPNPSLAQGQIVRVIGMLQRPSPAMNPGQFNWADYYRDQRVLASITIPQAGDITILDDGITGPIAWLRQQARRLLARGFESRYQLDHALLCALLLGDNDPELRNVQEQFRRTGTSHHLAISGMHVAVLGGVVFLLCRLARVGPRKACWLALIFVILYGLVALPSPPVVRSIVLCVSFSIGILQRKSLDVMNLLAVSVVAMLVCQPLDLYNAGFQLSFGMVLGLILFTPVVLELLPGPDLDSEIAYLSQWPGPFGGMRWKASQWLRGTAAAAIVAWIIAMPLIAYHFEQLNPWAIPASLILGPIVFIALIGGFAKVMLTLLWPSASAIWAQIAVIPVGWMRHVVEWLARFPGSDVPLPAPPVWMIVLFYGLLLLWLVKWKWPAIQWSIRSMALVGCVVLAIFPLRSGFATVTAREGELKVTLLAIGAGQCAVVEPPGAPAVLVDAGSATTTDVLYKALGPFLRHEGRREIKSIFISHANLDHFSAVAEASAAYDVEEIFVAPQFRAQSVTNPSAEGMLRALDQLDRPPREIATGRSFDLGSGAQVEVIWPTADCPYDANNTSLVLRLSFAGKSVLFTGDIQGPAERDLMQSGRPLGADVLIAPHHGSRESTTAAFIDAVSPMAIVCSNDRTLSSKQKEFDRETQGRAVYRTHTSGAVTIRISKSGQVSIDRFLTQAR